MRSRFRVWMLMALVALVAVGWSLVGKGVELHAEAKRRWEMAEGHDYQEAKALKVAVAHDERAKIARDQVARYGPNAFFQMTRCIAVPWGYELKESEEFSRRYHRTAAFHAAMRRKYNRAAWLPWLPVAPDPPSPPVPE